MNREKLLEPDILRTMAFLAVVAQHVLGAYAKREIGPLTMKAISLCFELTRFAVPVFVFLFAAMLFYQHSQEFSYLPYLAKRAKQLLVPYMIWTTVYMLMSKGMATFSIRDFGGALLLGNGSYHLWYVIMIFQFVIAAPFLIAMVRRMDQWGNIPRKRLVIWGGLFILSLAYLRLTPGIAGDSSLLCALFFTYRSRVFLSWLVFFFTGAFYGLHYQDFCRYIKKIWILCGVVFAASLVYAFRLEFDWVQSQGSVNFSLFSFLNPGFAFITLMGIAVLFRLAMTLKKNKTVNRVCALIGGVSYWAYLAHVACINLINRFTVGWFSSQPIYYLWLYASTVVAAIGIGYAQKKIMQSAARIIRTQKKA